MQTYTLDEALVKKVIKTVSAGLCIGEGKPKPGQMCVEAAVCYAMGLPHSDEPTCVHDDVRLFKIELNDQNWSSRKARAKGMLRVAIAQLGSDTIDGEVFQQQLQLQFIEKIFPIMLANAAIASDIEEDRAVLLRCAETCKNNPRLSVLKAVLDETEVLHYRLQAVSWVAYNNYRAGRSTLEQYNRARAAGERIQNLQIALSLGNSTQDTERGFECITEDMNKIKRDLIYSAIAECAVQALIAVGSPGCKYLYLLD